MRRFLILTLALTLVVPFMSSLLAGPQDLVASPEYVAGDLEKLADRWLETLQRNPDSLEAQGILLLWGRVLGDLPRSQPTADDWRAIRRPIKNGWSARLAAWKELQAHLAEESIDEADALGMDVGSPRQWIGIGPFGKHTAISLHRPYPPEVEFEAETPQEGTVGKVQWRAVSTTERDTRVYPQNEWRQRGAIYYLRSRFAIDADQELLLQCSSPGSFRLWIDGTAIAVVDRQRERLPQVSYIGVQLSAGEHTILLKGDGSSVAVLFRTADGFPAPIESLDPWGSGDTGIELRPELQPDGLATTELLARRAQQQLGRRWSLPLAVLLASSGNELVAREVLLEAEAEADPVPLALAATLIADQIRYLPTDWKKNWLSELWTRALKSNENVVPIRIAQARQRKADDKDLEAMTIVESILEDQPRSLTALRMREQLCYEGQWEREYLTTMRRMVDLAPEHPDVLRSWISHWSSYTSLPHRALPLREKLFRLEPGFGTGRSLAQAYHSAGQTERALHVLDQMMEYGGGGTESLRQRRSLLTQWGRLDDALTALAEMTKRVPDDHSLWIAQGDLLWGENRREEAVASYRAALALDPGQIAVLRKLQFLERELAGEAAEPSFWAPYRIDGDEAIRNQPAGDRYPKAAAVYLLDQAVTRFGVDGGIEDMVHMVVRLDSQESVNEFSTIRIPGEILELRVITPDGRELHPTSGGGGGSYTLPGLETGSIVEQRYVVRRNLRDQEDAAYGPFYFRDTSLANAFHVSELVLLLPSDWTPRLRERAMTFDHTERELESGYREFVWRAEEMDRFEPEKQSPPVDFFIPNVALVAESEWEDALDAVAARSAQPDFVSPELESATKEILEGVAGRKSKVRALYNAVCDRVKTWGRGANATEVWLMRRGNRDLALAGLFRAAEIPFERVTATIRDDASPYTDWSEPNPNLFQMPLLRVTLEDGEHLYVTAAFRLSTPGRIPAAYQGARAVVATPSGGVWTTLPRTRIEDEAQSFHCQFRLTGPNEINVQARLEYRDAQTASSYKEGIQRFPSMQRTVWAEQVAKQFFPGSRMNSSNFPDLETRENPFRFEFDITTNVLIQSAGDRSLLKAIVNPLRMSRRFIGKPERKLPYVGAQDNLSMDEVAIDLGNQYEVTDLPEDLNLMGDWGSYHLSYRIEGNQVLVKRQFRLEPFLLEPWEYPKFIDVCSSIDRKEKERISLRELK